MSAEVSERLDKVADRAKKWAGRARSAWRDLSVSTLTQRVWAVVGLEVFPPVLTFLAAARRDNAFWVAAFISPAIVLYAARALASRSSRARLAEIQSEHEGTVRVLQRDLDMASNGIFDIERTLKELLHSMFRQGGKLDRDCRVTVYGYHNRQFVLVSRHASLPGWIDQEDGHLPDGFGACAKAYVDGVFSDTDGPDPVGQRNEYLRWQANMGVPADFFDEFSMPTRSYVASALTVDGDTVGVLVLESRKPTGLTLESLPDPDIRVVLGMLTRPLVLLKYQAKRAVIALEVI